MYTYSYYHSVYIQLHSNEKVEIPRHYQIIIAETSSIYMINGNCKIEFPSKNEKFFKRKLLNLIKNHNNNKKRNKHMTQLNRNNFPLHSTPQKGKDEKNNSNNNNTIHYIHEYMAI